MRQMRTANERIAKLALLANGLRQEKGELATLSKEKVEKSALQLVLTETADTLGKAVVARNASRIIARNGGGRRSGR